MGAAGGGTERVADHAVEITRELLTELRPGAHAAVSLDSHFGRDLDLDSMARLELLSRLSARLGLRFPEQALAESDSLRALLGWAMPVADAAPLPALGLDAPARLDTPETACTLTEVLAWRAAREAGRTHVLLRGEAGDELPLSFGALQAEAQRCAGALAAAGVEPGQTVGLMLPTGREYLSTFFGVLLAGAVPVPLYPPARLSQVDEHVRRHAGILRNARSCVLVTVPQAQPVASRLRLAAPTLDRVLDVAALAGGPPLARTPAATDTAFVQYTSGSTGDPKGVVLSHANLLANLRAMGHAVGVDARDCFVSWLPLYHDMGLIGAWLGALYYGFPLVLMSPLVFLARPVAWLEALSAHRATLSAAPNFAYALCARGVRDADLAGLDLSSWRLALNGAEPVNPDTLDAFATRFASVGLRREALMPVYGLAENAVGLAFPPPGRGPRLDRVDAERLARDGAAEPAATPDAAVRVVASCGFVLPGHELRVVDRTGEELPARRVGRLEFRGPSATAGYLNNPAANAGLRHGDWLDTGDLAYLADGELFLTGRVKDIIIRGGRNLYPYALEQAVGELPGVRRGGVAVFGCPAADGQSERLAVLAETRETDPRARARLHDAIAACVREVMGEPANDIVLAPPHAVLKTSSGKLRRAATRAFYLSGRLQQREWPVWLLATGLTVRAAAAEVSVALRRLGRRAWGLWALALLGLMAPVLGALLWLRPQATAANRRLARRAARLWCVLTALPVHVDGLGQLPAGVHVLVCNHAGYADGLLLTALLPAGYAFAVKEDVAAWPFAGMVLRRLGARFIARFDPARAAEGVATLAEALARGQPLVVFPEGTFGRAPGVRAFRLGAFAAAAQQGVPVVVAGLRGARQLLRDGTLLPQRTGVVLDIGEVLHPVGSDWSAALALAQAARASMVPRTGEADLDAGGGVAQP